MKSDMMKYKGYKASIAYDEDDKIFRSFSWKTEEDNLIYCKTRSAD